MMTPAQRRYLKRREKLAEEKKELEEERKALAVNCTHPLEFVEPYQWEHDNGYGKQSKVDGLRCTICYRVKHWLDSSLWD